MKVLEPPWQQPDKWIVKEINGHLHLFVLNAQGFYDRARPQTTPPVVVFNDDTKAWEQHNSSHYPPRD
jgi:hypothetical protein